MSSRPLPPRRTDRPFSPRHWSLRTKLLVVLLVPAILAMVLGGLRIADQARQAAELDRITRFVAAQGEVVTLIEQLQRERSASTLFVADGRRGDVAALQTVFAEMDAAAAGTRPVVADLAQNDADLAGAQRQAEQALARVGGLRSLVQTSNAPASAVVSRYSDLIAQQVELDNTLLRGINTTEVSGLANALAGLGAARNEASLQQAIVTTAILTRELPDSAATELQASDARLRKGLLDFRAALDAGQRVRYAALIAGPANTARERLTQGVLAGAPSPADRTAAAADAAGVYTAFVQEVDASTTGVRDELSAISAERRQTAVGLASLNAILLLLALLVGAVVVGLIARRMITSLRTLRSSALDVAENQLPDAVQRMREGSVPEVEIRPVPIDTREEVGQVARAFDAVHAQAVRLAAEQATLQSNVNSMFVNLSRRSQTLVDRQLQLIEELEASEPDADQLSNLFRLDHLATRMRRNSENLLVLAGTDLVKSTAMQPMPLVDVLRAALSEIEQYERIELRQTPSAMIAGRTASDLRHLLAELLDNATSFSPPSSKVAMAATWSPNGDLVVEVADSGIGMDESELAAINAELARSGDVTVRASRRMGLFVVGRLAAQHGIAVSLIQGPPGEPSDDPDEDGGPGSKVTGLTARVVIPRYVIVSGAPSRGAPLTLTAEQDTPPGGSAPSDAIPSPRSAGDRDQPSVASAGPVGSPQFVPQSAADPESAAPLPRRPPRQRPAPAPAPASASAEEGPARGDSEQPAQDRPEPAQEQGPPAADDDRAAAARPEDPARRPSMPPPPVGTPTMSREPRPGVVWDHAAGLFTSPNPSAAPSPSGNGPAGPPSGRPRAAPRPAQTLPPTARPARPAAPSRPGAEAPSNVPSSDQTPIFEEVASRWFRSRRQVPVEWRTGPMPSAQSLAGPRESEQQTPVPAAPPEPATASASALSRPVETGGGSGAFTGPADVGWRSAERLLEPAEAAGTLTSAGLPVRNPGARLVPGSAGPSEGQGATRDAEAIRARLKNYQRGVRQARTSRHQRVEAENGSPSTPPDAPHPEGKS